MLYCYNIIASHCYLPFIKEKLSFLSLSHSLRELLNEQTHRATIIGEPSPRVTWFKEHALIDDSFTKLENGSVINVLHLQRITRADLETVSVELCNLEY